jgi:hypothetical protein
MQLKKNLTALLLLVCFAGLASAGTLSIDKINLDSESRIGDTGQGIVITVSADGEAQEYQLYRSSDYFSEQVGKDVESSLTMDLNNVNTWAEYPIEGSGQEAPYTIRLDTFTYDKGGNQLTDSDIDYENGRLTDSGEKKAYQYGLDNGCIDPDNNGAYGYVKPEVDFSLDNFGDVYVTINCAKKDTTLASSVSDFRAPVEHYEVDLTMDNGQGTVCSETITTEGRGNGQTTYLCDRDIRVDTEGGLTTPTPVPLVDGLYIAHYDNWDGGGFRVIGEENYEDWSDKQGQLESKIVEYATQTGDKSSVESWWNQDAREAVQWTSSGLWSQRNELEFRDNNLGTDGNVALDAWPGSGSLVNPVLTITAEAGPNSFVVFKETSGVPQINSVSEEQLADSTSTAFDVEVENVGEDQGQFEVRPESCTENFDPVSSGKYVNMEPGQVETLTFVVSGSATEGDNTIEGSCTFTAQDTVSQEKDSMSGDITLNQDTTCEPGEKSRGLAQNENGETVWTIFECSDDGRTEDPKTYCEPDEKVAINNGQYSCVASGGNGGGGGGDDGCGQWDLGFTKTPDYLCEFERFAKGGLAIVVPVLLRNTGIPKRITVGAGIVIGAVFGILSWFAFWLVLVVLVFLAIMGIIVSSLNPMS